MQPDCALATGISGVIFESSGDSPRSGHSTPPGTASAAAWCACGRLRIPCPGWRQSMALIDFAEQPQGNPLEVVERVAATNGWSFERAGEDEITILAAGKWTDYQISYTWMYDIEALHLISLINEQMWVGHFDLWTQDGLVMYRHALVLAGGVEASGRQCEALLGTALDACERYFPAFQFVVWAGKSAREALDSAMFETAGEA